MFFFKLFNKVLIFINVRKKKSHLTVSLMCFSLVFDVVKFCFSRLDRISFYKSTIEKDCSHLSVNFGLYSLKLKCSCIDCFLAWQTVRVNEKDFLQFLLADF